ncbi:HNH endonuclease [Nitratireductor sp. GISD-1A_MAKvit]|uniref:HNH endonuclease n=1 Tax=Nitratireductor sp. GISD-1A_MAKvit TaxID=3234198 RepID=UPI0034650265
MKIKDLPAPVTASKADWLPGTTWLGFTPTDGDLGSRNKCQSTIQRQFGSGYVIEYITETFQKPNDGFENDPQYIADREAHKERAGRLIAVHKLRTTSRSLETILGPEEFKLLQDMWAQEGKRFRWSVAFPIVESYRIKDPRKAKEIFGPDAYARLYAHSSATLRPLRAAEQHLIAELEIERVDTKNSWIGIEDEFALAERSEINPDTERAIGRDLGALEGMEAERLVKVKRRAAWIADRFIRERQKAGMIACDACDFDPAALAAELGVKARGFLDVHHKNPLDEGGRYTTTADFALLCPTCHRVEHIMLRKVKKASSV